jgi:hypothetical protein
MFQILNLHVSPVSYRHLHGCTQQLIQIVIPVIFKYFMLMSSAVDCPQYTLIENLLKYC